MKRHKPLIDESGEVRELLLEDLKRFRPASEILTHSLAAKLGVKPATGTALENRMEAALRKQGSMGKLEAIYRAILDRPRARDDEVAVLADQYAGDRVSVRVVGNRRGEVRWMLRELERRGWLTQQAAQEVKPLLES
jgi:hypothetical protein